MRTREAQSCRFESEQPRHFTRHAHTADVLAAGLVDTKAALLSTSTQLGGTMVSSIGGSRTSSSLPFFSFSVFPVEIWTLIVRHTSN